MIAQNLFQNFQEKLKITSNTSRKVNHGISSLWKTIGNAGLGFLNVLPTLGKTIYSFIGSIFTDLFIQYIIGKLNLKKCKKCNSRFFYSCWFHNDSYCRYLILTMILINQKKNK